jgi:succinate dehydrogenase hydrophobic anchor subunit
MSTPANRTATAHGEGNSESDQRVSTKRPKIIFRLIAALAFTFLAVAIYYVFLNPNQPSLAENVKPTDGEHVKIIGLGVLATAYAIAGIGQLTQVIEDNPRTAVFRRWTTLTAWALSAVMFIVLFT